MKPITVVVVVLVCVFATFTATLYFVNKDKEQEINNLRETVRNLTSQLHQYVGDEDMLVGTWIRYLGNESISFDTLYINEDGSARLEYTGHGALVATYSFENGKLIFKSGTEGREFSYCFLDENTLVVSNPYLTWPVDPKAIYIKSSV